MCTEAAAFWSVSRGNTNPGYDALIATQRQLVGWQIDARNTGNIHPRPCSHAFGPPCFQLQDRLKACQSCHESTLCPLLDFLDMSVPLLQPIPRPLFTTPSFLKYRSPPLTTPSSTPVPYNGETPSPPDSPSSAAATVATSTSSDASSPFDSSPPTPRATSPDFALRSAAPFATPSDRISQASQPAFIRYVPPPRPPPPAWPPSQPHPVPFSFTQGLAAELERFVVLSHVANRTRRNINAPPAVIGHVHVSGGYKWIEPPTGVKGPTIAVPGAPDVWIGRGRTSERIKHDADLPGNNQYPDCEATQ